jgi:hypothetical protein
MRDTAIDTFLTCGTFPSPPQGQDCKHDGDELLVQQVPRDARECAIISWHADGGNLRSRLLS